MTAQCQVDVLESSEMNSKAHILLITLLHIRSNSLYKAVKGILTDKVIISVSLKGQKNELSRLNEGTVANILTADMTLDQADRKK